MTINLQHLTILGDGTRLGQKESLLKPFYALARFSLRQIINKTILNYKMDHDDGKWVIKIIETHNTADAS